MTKFPTKPVLAVAVAAGLLALSACASSGTSSPKGDSSDAASAIPASVPTLKQLYAGTEHAPPSTGPAAVKGKTVVYISCGQAAPACAATSGAAAEAAKTLGWNFKVLDAKFNAGGAFGSSIRQAIVLKPDAIVVDSINCNAAQQPLQEAKDAGIPVLGVLNQDCDEQGGPKLQPVPMLYNKSASTRDEFWTQWGNQRAAYLIRKSGGKAKVIDMYFSDAVIEAHKGFVSMLDKCTGCSVAADVPFLGTEMVPGGPLIQRFTTALARHPEANAFEIDSDSPFIISGLLAKMNSMPEAKKLLSMGGEGQSPTMDVLRKNDGGVPDAVDGVDVPWIGYAAMDSLNRYFAGKPAVPEGFGSRIIDTDSKLPSSGAYVSPIDWKAAYNKVWTGSGN